MTNEEIIEEMARVMFRSQREHNEAQWESRNEISKGVWRTLARAAFAIASARIREQCAEKVDKLTEALPRTPENAPKVWHGRAIAVALRQPKAVPNA